jgi:hypothetical protein
VDSYGVVGAGGFGREVMPLAVEMLAASQTRNFELVFVIEGLAADTAVDGYRIISKESFMAHGTGERYFSIAIADAMIRMRIGEHEATKLTDLYDRLTARSTAPN